MSTPTESAAPGPASGRTVSLVILMAAIAVLVVAPMIRPFLPVDETRYLSVAWEMRLSGDPFHLTMNGAAYSHKPPLLFWLINLAWMLAGPSELAARLIGPLAAVAVLGMTGLLARRLSPDRPGLPLGAMAVLGATSGFLLYGGATMFDALLTVWVLLGIGAIWRLGQGARGRLPWVVLGLAIGLGVLTKGPVVLLHLLPVLLTLRYWGAAPPGLRDALRGFALSLGIALLLVAVWLVPLLIGARPGFLYELLWAQSADRVAGGLGHSRPVWYLLTVLPALIFPFGWSLSVWRGMPAAVWADGAGRMLAIWALTAFALFSLVGGKQLHYLLPELPAFAILVARALPFGRRSVLLAFILPALFALVALAAVFGLVPAKGMEEAVGPAWVLILAALGFAGLALAALRLPLPAGHAIAGIGTALLAVLVLGLSDLGPRMDPRPLGQQLKAAEAGGLAVWHDNYQAEFNFAGRLTAPIAVLNDEPALAAWVAAHPQGTVLAATDTPPGPAAPAQVTPFGTATWGLWPTAALTSPGSAPAD